MSLERLREHLRDPAFRAIEGFPIGDDEAILALSDPPYYTACPNPFLGEIVERWQAERAQLRAELGLPNDSDENAANGAGTYHREPFAADVSEGKNDPIYNAHSYHTKVPHKAIMRYILHYTDPGDIVFDGFCGSGMTGVAAAQLGRRSLLAELSPAASFMAHAYCHPVDPDRATEVFREFVHHLRSECGWLYAIAPDERGSLGLGVEHEVQYAIWSEVFACPYCTADFAFADVGFDFSTKRPRDRLRCPHCGAALGTDELVRVLESDRKTKDIPVRVAYVRDGRAREIPPSDGFLSLVDEIERRPIPYWYPDDVMMHQSKPDSGWGDMWRRGYHSGYLRVSDFFYKRTLWVLAATLEFVRQAKVDEAGRHLLLQTLANTAPGITKMRRAYQGVIPLVLYLPKLKREVNAIHALTYRAQAVVEGLRELRQAGAVAITTQSSTALPNVPDACIDYVFTDPPFGNNIIYSEVNFIAESWLRAFTNRREEAIISSWQNKRLPDYQNLMRQAFSEAHRVLKPGRWITVEFHNSRNSVWNAIQEALQAAGFIVADVRVLDKQQISFKQASAQAAVKQDLIISAYRPRDTFERQFRQEAGTSEGAWDFVREHLAQLPRVVQRDGALESIAERQPHLLFDRMVAFHVQRGATVQLSAGEFYAGLRQRFVERDGMYFLADQVAEYDGARLQASRVEQLPLFVSDEKSTIQWLRQQLDPATGGLPQTYQEIQPRFLRQLHQARHEALPELGEILEQNFLQDGAGRWYVPDPNRATDLEKLRERALLREFAEYATSRGRLRQFRTEAVRAGFADAYRRGDFQMILKVAERLPEAVLQEDPDLLMYYDNASLRAG